MAVPDEETAIAVANDTKYGLGGSVYTRDLERGRRVADQIDAGMVFVNHPPWIYEDMPFGGIKKSGYGRETGPLGIREFVNKKLFARYNRRKLLNRAGPNGGDEPRRCTRRRQRP